MTEPKGRYCGSKHSHGEHQWQMIGRPEGPTFKCRGKGLYRDASITMPSATKEGANR